MSRNLFVADLTENSYGPTGGHFSVNLLLMTYIQFADKLWMTPDQAESILAHMPGWVASQKIGPKLRSHAEGPACDATGPDVSPETCDAYAAIGRSDGMREVGSRNTMMDFLALALPFPGNLGWLVEREVEFLREQMGPKLESTGGGVRTLVADHIEWPSEN